jgi:agmatine deiminase
MNTRVLPAEWAPQSFVQLTFPHQDTDWNYMLNDALDCFIQVAETIARYEDVLIVSPNPETIQSRFSRTADHRIFYAQLPTNDTWARDHGGITILEDDQPIVLDFVFNGWGLKFPANLDNLITSRLQKAGVFGKTPLRHGGIVLEGGALESDGQGSLLTSSECLLSPNRNPHLDKAEIEETIKNLFGLQRILWLDYGYLAGDDTDSHIDTLARFCNPETIAYVRCDNPADEHFRDLRKMEAQLQSFTTARGDAYNLVPLPWPDACYDPEGNRLPATYANFLIVNHAVLVPTYGMATDIEALETLKSVFPDRDVIGVNCLPLIQQHGSLHCITMQYPAQIGRLSRNF